MPVWQYLPKIWLIPNPPTTWCGFPFIIVNPPATHEISHSGWILSGKSGQVCRYHFCGKTKICQAQLQTIIHIEHNAWAVAWANLPAIPCLWITFFFLSFFWRSMDRLYLKITLKRIQNRCESNKEKQVFKLYELRISNNNWLA